MLLHFSKTRHNALLSVVIILLLSGCSTSTTSEESGSPAVVAPKQLWVTSERLNRRTCPSEKCGSVGQLMFRESATVYEKQNGWGRITEPYHASCKNGKSEYVDSGNAACNEINGIKNGQFAEWVAVSHLSTTRPADPAANAKGRFELVKGSDDYQKYKNIFAQTAETLIRNGTCSEGDFHDMGGFWKSTTHRNKPIYFTYCGGMTIENKIYLDASDGNVFR